MFWNDQIKLRKGCTLVELVEVSNIRWLLRMEIIYYYDSVDDLGC